MNGKKIVSIILIGAIFGFLLWNILQNWGVVRAFPWHFNTIDVVLLVIVSFLIYPIDAFSWHRIVNALGANTNYLTNLKIWVFSNAARFIPGVVWQYAGRVYLANRSGIPKLISTTALILEALFTVGVAALLVAVTVMFGMLPFQLDGVRNLLMPLIMISALTVTVVLFALSNERFANRILSFNLTRSLINKFVGKQNRLARIRLSPVIIPVIIVSFLLQFIAGGSALFFLVRNAVDLSLALYPLFIGIYAFAWLSGYLTFFSPSGLGIQDLVLAALLSLYMPFAIASVVAIIFRVLLLVVEVSTLLVIPLLLRKKGLDFV